MLLLCLLVVGGVGAFSLWGGPGPEGGGRGLAGGATTPALALSTPRASGTGGAGAISTAGVVLPSDPAERFLGFIVEAEEAPADTIRYRVCKDVVSCFPKVATPAPGIVFGAASAAPLALMPAGIFQAAVLPAAPGYLLGLPLLGLLWLPHSSGGNHPTPPVTPVQPVPPSPPPPGPPPPPPTTVPEPMTMLLVGSGLAGLAAVRRRG